MQHAPCFVPLLLAAATACDPGDGDIIAKDTDAGMSAGMDAGMDADFAADRDPLPRHRCDRREFLPLPGPRYYPEGIAVGPDGSFYVGSLGTGAIVRFRPRSAVPESFVPPADLFAVYGLAVDPARQSLWACTYDDTLLPEQPAYVTRYDLQSGDLMASYALPGDNSFCNDLIVGDRGTLYATDAFANAIVKLAPGAQQLTTFAVSPLFTGGPDAITVNGIVFDRRQGRLLVVNYDTGALLSVPILPDGSAGTITPIELDAPLVLPDGLEMIDHDTLLVVENYVGGQVSTIELDQDQGIKTTIATGLLEPTTVALHRGDAWVLEGQLSQLFGDDMPSLPFRALRVPIPD